MKVEEKLSYREMIGDGKFPNKYWVFQYDQKYKRVKQKDGSNLLEIIKEDTENNDSLVGEFSTFKEALTCVDDKAYLPNVVIEDRLSGQVFEQRCILCQECGKEDWESDNDIRFSKEEIEKNGDVFK